MLLRPGLFLLLLSNLHAECKVKEVSAMVGSDVTLSCVHPNRSHFDLDDLYVYWQIQDSDIVVTYYFPENASGQEDNRYKNRAHLSQDLMKQGDFSLHLQNVTPQDTQGFKCLVFRKSMNLGKTLEEVIQLRVAANFSVPVVSTPSAPSQGQEVILTCRSTDGYPRPNVYWVNRTDESRLDVALQNLSVSLNQRGLYDVVSTLRIPWTSYVNVGCCVENVLLGQTLNSGHQAEASSGNSDKFTESPESPHVERNAVLCSVLAVLSVVTVAAVLWLRRSRRPRSEYTGAQAAAPGRDQELTDHD